MLEIVVDVIKEFGIWGLLTSLAIEASSLPFPGGLVTLVFGYILNLTMTEVILYGLLASAVYTCFSLIPYYIGAKFEDKLKEKTSRKKIEKAQKWFQKCGVWGIAIARPIGLGNYVSYAAGLSKINIGTFLSLTLLGILPWTIAVLWLGSVGNLKSVKSFMDDFQLYAIIAVVVGVFGYILYRRKKKHRRTEAQEKAYE